MDRQRDEWIKEKNRGMNELKKKKNMQMNMPVETILFLFFSFGKDGRVSAW